MVTSETRLPQTKPSLGALPATADEVRFSTQNGLFDTGCAPGFYEFTT
jgi:hypothetical protein